MGWLRRLGHQCADFVVCATDFQMLAVVELQADAGPVTDRMRRRLERMSRSMKAAKITLRLWAEGSLPCADAVRKAIIPTPPTESAAPATSLANTTEASPAPAPATTVAATPPPQKAASPFEDSDSTQDERIEPLEPPASTWFDDLDSAPAPLRKP